MEKIFIQNRYRLKISMRLTKGTDANKLVFLTHGLGARKEYLHMLVLEEEFAKNGYTVVNFDSTNSINESDISADGTSVLAHYQDLEDVINWAKTQDFYVEPFALSGQSLGACAIVKYAEIHPGQVNLLVPVALPFLNGEEHVQHDRKIKDILKKGCYEQYSKSTGKTLKIYKKYYDDLKVWDTLEDVSKISAKTYVVVGLEDSAHHIECGKQLYSLLACQKELKLLKGVPHDLANTPETKAIFTKCLEEIFEELKNGQKVKNRKIEIKNIMRKEAIQVMMSKNERLK